MPKLKLFLPLFIFIIVIIFLWKNIARDPSEIPSPLIGKLAPPFQGANLFHPHQKINQSIFLNHVSLLNVFASWCVSCRVEHSVLMHLHQMDPKIQIIGLCYKDHENTIKKWFAQSGNPYRAIINDPNGNIGIDFGVYGTPETFIIDSHAVILGKIIGPISPAEMRLIAFQRKTSSS